MPFLITRDIQKFYDKNRITSKPTQLNLNHAQQTFQDPLRLQRSAQSGSGGFDRGAEAHGGGACGGLLFDGADHSGGGLGNWEAGEPQSPVPQSPSL